MKKLGAEYDVLVVGAGPVGVVLSRLLGNAGVRTLLIDRERDVMRIPRAIALDDDGGRVLQAIGDSAALRRQMTRIERVRMLSPAVGDLLSFDASCWRNGNPMILMFRQPELEDVLREGLARCPTVEFRTGVTLASFTDEGDGVTAVLSTAAGHERARAGFLVGCDGAHSTVRRLLGVEMEGSTYERDWLVIDVRHDPAPDREVRFLCDPARPGVTMPAPRGGRRWEFMLGPGDDRETMTSPEALRRLLAPWGDPAQMGVERAAVYTFHARVAARLQQGRAFLAGDAAHLTPPFAGQGLMAGLRDVANLAWKLAAVSRGDAGSGLLATYQTERLPNARTMVNFARLMGEIIMARDPARCLVRDWLLRPAARLPGIRGMLSSVEVKPRTRITRGLLAPGRPLAAVQPGDLLPQCTLRRPARAGEAPSITLLDDHLGYRWALIGIGVEPSRYLRRDQQARWQQLGTTLQVTTQAGGVGHPSAALDLDGGLTGALRAGTCLVARPDRHLYAVVEARQLERTLDALTERLGAESEPSARQFPALVRIGAR